MKKLLLLLLVFAALGGSVAPSISNLLGFFTPAVAHAGNDDSQGDNDNQGEDEQ
jgi:hypothetical protein